MDRNKKDNYVFAGSEFCGATNTILLDKEQLRGFYEVYKAPGVLFLAAHEAAHAVQLGYLYSLKEPFHELSSSVQEFIERNIELPEFFNNDGVFRVFTQIIISILSLNTRESGILNEVGKIEANRAAHAYILNWVNQSK